MTPDGHAEHLSHEAERPVGDRLAALDGKRREAPRDDDVVTMHAVNGSGEGVDEPAIPFWCPSLTVHERRSKVDVDVRLVPHLPVTHPRQSAEAAVVAGRDCASE